MMQNVCILGSTGSIGCSTLDVIERNPERYRVTVLTAQRNVQKMLQQCIQFNPEKVVMRELDAAEELKILLSEKQLSITVLAGESNIIEAPATDGLGIVVAAIVGAAGLLPTLTAVKQGHKVLLANKEALVMSGDLFTKAVTQYNATLLPVDSEHNAIFQSLPNSGKGVLPTMEGVNKVLLTGSGGPFRRLPLEQLSKVTPEQACAHPNWDMGQKISVDSATMMNKGLELIEACFLFNLSIEQVDIVVHPQSIVHSMVSYKDGSVIAQMGRPDMRTPIAHTLAWPDRIDAGVPPLDFYTLSNLSFEAPDFERFPCLRLAKMALERGGTSPCILNAANEVAVAAFLDKKIAFTDIALIIEETINCIDSEEVNSIDAIISVDSQAREKAYQVIDILIANKAAGKGLV